MNSVGHLTSITLTDTGTPALTLTAAQVAADTAALGKISNATYNIKASDTAANVSANIAALNANSHLVSIALTDTGTPKLTLTASQALTDTVALGKITNAYTVAVVDTAANVIANLAGLSADTHLSSITATDTKVSVGVSTFNANRTALDKIVGGFALADQASAIQGGINAIQADIGNIAGQISVLSSTVSVSAATFVQDRTALDRLSSAFVVVDTAANVTANFAALNADGHISSITANNADGSKSVTTYDLTNSQTWKSQVAAYDTSNRLTSLTLNNRDGTKVVTAYDVTNTYPWTTQVSSYDSSGNLVTVVNNNDDGTQTGSRPDGSHWTTVFDSSNKYNWSSFRTDYNGSSQMTSQTVVNDNLTSVVNAYNPANGSWASITIYNPAGHALVQTGTNSDGSHWLTANDANNQYAWSTFTINYNSGWGVTSQSGTNDDGTATTASQIGAAMDTINYYTSPYLPIPTLTPTTGTNADGSTWSTLTDTTDAYSWATITKTYTAGGVLSSLTGTNDSGSSWSNVYDTTGTASYSWYINVYDAGGHLVTQTGTNRDGTHWLTAIDVNTQYNWSTFTINYDANWNVTSKTEHNHDGTTTVDAGAISAALDVLTWYSSPYDPTPTSPPGGNGGDGLPVILDLTGNGINLSPLGQSSAIFDMTGSGQRVHTAWAGSGDGILAIDLGNDGKPRPEGIIDQSKQIVFSEWDPGATSDMQALRDVFDTNHDGKLDADDKLWSDFRIWQDANGDGVSQTGEVKTLDQLGITAIDLNPTGPAIHYADGSVINGETTYTRVDGTTGIAADVGLAYAGPATGAGQSAHPSNPIEAQFSQFVQAMAAYSADSDRMDTFNPAAAQAANEQARATIGTSWH